MVIRFRRWEIFQCWHQLLELRMRSTIFPYYTWHSRPHNAVMVECFPSVQSTPTTSHRGSIGGDYRCDLVPHERIAFSHDKI